MFHGYIEASSVSLKSFVSINQILDFSKLHILEELKNMSISSRKMYQKGSNIGFKRAQNHDFCHIGRHILN